MLYRSTALSLEIRDKNYIIKHVNSGIKKQKKKKVDYIETTEMLTKEIDSVGYETV